jgi:putative transposase
MPDHVHILLSVPPKYALAEVVGYIKGKSAIHIARVYAVRRAALPGEGILGVDARMRRAPHSSN